MEATCWQRGQCCPVRVQTGSCSGAQQSCTTNHTHACIPMPICVHTLPPHVHTRRHPTPAYVCTHVPHTHIMRTHMHAPHVRTCMHTCTPRPCTHMHAHMFSHVHRCIPTPTQTRRKMTGHMKPVKVLLFSKTGKGKQKPQSQTRRFRNQDIKQSWTFSEKQQKHHPCSQTATCWTPEGTGHT